MRIAYDGLDVTFEGPPREVVTSHIVPVPPPVPEAPVARLQPQDEKIDIFGPEGENLMLTDPLAYEEMVERVLREKRV